jgi:hypothetical protein
MIPDDIKITSEILLIGTGMFILLDAIAIPLLAWRVKRDIFRYMKWHLMPVAGVIWFLIWQWAISNYWGTVYRYIFPTWAQTWIPPAFGLVMAGVCFGLWALAVQTKYPAVIFCLLGGVWGICGHIWAVFQGLVTKPPMLQGASPVAAVTIAFFEYAFYWYVIAAIAALIAMVPGLKPKEK